MARSGRDEAGKAQQGKEEKKPQAVVASKPLAQRMVTYSQSPVPVRTVIFMEVGDTPADQVRQAIAHVKTIHGEGMHPTFVLPVRNRKLTGDVIFEGEILDMVRALCEVKDGEIVLRDGARDVDVMRTQL